MTTKSGSRYEVGIKNQGVSFSQDGRKESWTKTYNLEDCKNHIAELRNYVYDGKKPYGNTQFVIRTITTVETEIDY